MSNAQCFIVIATRSCTIILIIIIRTIEKIRYPVMFIWVNIVYTILCNIQKCVYCCILIARHCSRDTCRRCAVVAWSWSQSNISQNRDLIKNHNMRTHAGPQNPFSRVKFITHNQHLIAHNIAKSHGTHKSPPNRKPSVSRDRACRHTVRNQERIQRGWLYST